MGKQSTWRTKNIINADPLNLFQIKGWTGNILIESTLASLYKYSATLICWWRNFQNFSFLLYHLFKLYWLKQFPPRKPLGRLMLLILREKQLWVICENMFQTQLPVTSPGTRNPLPANWHIPVQVTKLLKTNTKIDGRMAECTGKVEAMKQKKQLKDLQICNI